MYFILLRSRWYFLIKPIIATARDNRSIQLYFQKCVWIFLSFLELAGLVHGAAAVFVVKDANGTACIMANFSAAFLASYETRSGPKVGNTGSFIQCVVCV